MISVRGSASLVLEVLPCAAPSFSAFSYWHWVAKPRRSGLPS
jgi:hypothetical protein